MHPPQGFQPCSCIIAPGAASTPTLSGARRAKEDEVERSHPWLQLPRRFCRGTAAHIASVFAYGLRRWGLRLGLCFVQGVAGREGPPAALLRQTQGRQRRYGCCRSTPAPKHQEVKRGQTCAACCSCRPCLHGPGRHSHRRWSISRKLLVLLGSRCRWRPRRLPAVALCGAGLVFGVALLFELGSSSEPCEHCLWSQDYRLPRFSGNRLPVPVLGLR
jgi:hypothetical protein